jgi:hypothetical protein
MNTPRDTTATPPQLIWGNSTGWVSSPAGSIWVYTVSRPMVSPGNTTPYRAYKYDGTLPYGFQDEVELGLFNSAIDGQNACQADYDALGVVTIVPPPPA